MNSYSIITSVNMNEYSGVQKFVVDLSSYLLEHDSQVTIISNKDYIPLFAVHQLKDKTDIVCFLENQHAPVKSSSSYIKSGLSFLSVIVAAIKHHNSKISLIHAQDIFSGGFAGLMVKKIFDVPLIVHAHGPSPYFSSSISETTSFKKTIAQLLAIFVVQHSDLVLTTDNQTRQLISRFAGATPVLSIPTPIKINEYKCEKNEQNQSGFLLGTIGRLEPQKNLRTLLRVFSAIRPNLLNPRLIIIGSGSEKKLLSRDIANLGLNGSVILIENATNNEKKEYLKSFDVFVMVSIYEGCPIALLEAMGAAKAIVGSDIPPLREIIKSGEALLVNPYDEEALKKAILKLANEPNLRSDLGCKARKRAEDYDVNRVFDRLIKLYSELINNQ